MKKLDIKYIKNIIEVNDYELLSNKYIKSSSKIDLKCNKGHIYSVTWNNFQRGKRCPVCSGNKKKTYDEIKNFVEQYGFNLLSKNIKNSFSKIKLQCSKGHIFDIKYYNFYNRKKCPVCSNINKRVSYEKIKSYIENNKHILIDNKYICNDKKIKIQCNKGHIFYMAWKQIQYGYNCPICRGNRSKEEIEIGNLILSQYNGKIIFNDRTLIQNPKTGQFLELDIWLPELNKAIEYNGKYYHSDEYTIWKDNYKQQWCKENCIDLIVISEDEWLKNKDIEINKIKMFLRR